MLIGSKEKKKRGKVLAWSILLLFSLIVLKIIFPSLKKYLDEKSKDRNGIEAIVEPSIIVSNLNTEDILNSNKNRIFQRDNLSLFLNNELGTPTLMLVYNDSITELERNGRFLAFLYLKDPSE